MVTIRPLSCHHRPSILCHHPARPDDPGDDPRKMKKNYYVYILASKRNGTLYIGITADLVKRVWEHRSKFVEGFTNKYAVDKLVYYEIFEDPENAIRREKRLKKYNRKWKIDLVEQKNPDWRDLYQELI